MAAVASPSASAVPAPASRRWLALDVFRGIAIVSMIQGHTFTALLMDDAYEGSWVSWHKIVHGLTAPMFLIGGGLAYGMVSLRRGRLAPEVNARIVRRGLMLLALGYALQLPAASLSYTFGRPEVLGRVLKVGPLQLVGACLILFELLRARSRSLSGLALRVSVVCAAIIASAPVVWKLHLSETVSPLVGHWLDSYQGSLFPFWPWASFFGVGVLLAVARQALVAAHPGVARERLFAAGMLGLGAVLALSMYALYRNGLLMRAVYGDYELWRTSPLYVAFRSGLVLAWLGLLCLGERAIAFCFEHLPRASSMFRTLATSSLVAYVVHLFLLYGTPFSKGMVKMGKTLTMHEAILAFAGLMALTTLLTVAWERLVKTGVLFDLAAQRLARLRLSLARAR